MILKLAFHFVLAIPRHVYQFNIGKEFGLEHPTKIIVCNELLLSYQSSSSLIYTTLLMTWSKVNTIIEFVLITYKYTTLSHGGNYLIEKLLP